MKQRTSILAWVFLLTMALLPSTIRAQVTPTVASNEPELIEVDVETKVRRIAVPALVAPSPADTPAGNSATLGRQIAEVISANLRNSGLFEPQGPAGIRPIALEEVTA